MLLRMICNECKSSRTKEPQAEVVGVSLELFLSFTNVLQWFSTLLACSAFTTVHRINFIKHSKNIIAFSSVKLITPLNHNVIRLFQSALIVLIKDQQYGRNSGKESYFILEQQKTYPSPAVFLINDSAIADTIFRWHQKAYQREFTRHVFIHLDRFRMKQYNNTPTIRSGNRRYSINTDKYDVIITRTATRIAKKKKR